MSGNSKLHILFYAPTPPPYAGPEVATAALLEALKGDRVKLTHVRSNVRNENWKKGIFDLEGIMSFLRVYKVFIQALVKTSPDKVYFLLSSDGLPFLRDAVIVSTAKFRGKKVIAHYRGGNFHNFYSQRGPVFRWFIRQTLKHIDCLIVQAEALKSIFADLFPYEKMHVLYNGLKSAGHNSRYEPAGERPFTILFIGHIAFSKGFYELVLAFLRLRQRYQVRLLFAGEQRFAGRKRKSITGFLSGTARKFFVEHARSIEQSIAEFVEHADEYGAHYLGIIYGTEKTKAFAHADVFVLPSYTEGFSMSVLEAMAHGLPVVVTPVGAMPEIVKEGVNGVFVQPGDSKDLEEKLETLILNQAKARAMGQYNIRYVRERFSIEQIAEKLEDILIRV